MKRGITITELAKRFSLSRSSLLYYDRIGLLRASGRSSANYRMFTPSDVERLKQICFYRKMGISLKDTIRLIADTAEGDGTIDILKRRLALLDSEITIRQEQQHSILRLLEQLCRSSALRGGKLTKRRAGRLKHDKNEKRGIEEEAMVNKQRWIDIMSSAGFSEEDMSQWHRTFEQMEPEAHQEFLESLSIPAAEIAKIREASRS